MSYYAISTDGNIEQSVLLTNDCNAWCAAAPLTDVRAVAHVQQNKIITMETVAINSIYGLSQSETWRYKLQKSCILSQGSACTAIRQSTLSHSCFSLFYHCPPLRWQYCFRLSFFSVTTITRESLHLAWWDFARTCILTTAQNPKNPTKIKGQCHRTGFSDSLPFRDRAKKLVITITCEPLHLEK